MVDTPEQAMEIARAVQFPPTGIRGVASQTRAGRWGDVPEYLHAARSEICLITQIESRTAVENVDAIAAVDGVDALFVGPMDLSASLGYLGTPGAPEVVQAVEHVASRVHAAGKPIGILTVDEQQAARYVELGFDFVAVGMDTMLLRREAAALRRRFDREVARA
jgi:4-hydroxy-2-oxoheptanedioate aldolase